MAKAREEEWRDVSGYLYEVSSLGNVRRKGRSNLKPRLSSNGYCRVCLGAGNDALVHRLVATAFLGEGPEGWHADHINGQRSDNRLSNIRWLSPAANRARRNIARGARSGLARLTEDQVRAIRAAGFVRGQDRRFADQFGVSREAVRDVRLGKLWRHVDA